jgi:hypothetical protein
MSTGQQAEVCLILEGTYPYVAGGVSTWTHQLLLAQSHLSFALVCLVSEKAELTPRYEIPPNVTKICGPCGTRILADEKVCKRAHTESAAQRNRGRNCVGASSPLVTMVGTRIFGNQDCRRRRRGG